MNPRVMDAVGLIGRYVADNWESMVDHVEIHDELLNLGFSTREISDAFRWIEKNTLGVSDLPKAKKKSKKRDALSDVPQLPPAPIRVLAPMEQAKITATAYATLTGYFERGILDAVLLEEIIERAVQSDKDEIGDREIRRLTALALFTRVQSEWREYLHTTNTLVH